MGCQLFAECEGRHLAVCKVQTQRVVEAASIFLAFLRNPQDPRFAEGLLGSLSMIELTYILWPSLRSLAAVCELFAPTAGVLWLCMTVATPAENLDVLLGKASMSTWEGISREFCTFSCVVEVAGEVAWLRSMTSTGGTPRSSLSIPVVLNVRHCLEVLRVRLWASTAKQNSAPPSAP